MNITCPFCGTEYRYPQDKLKSDSRFRCSVCKNVFSIGPAPESREEKAASANGPQGIKRGAEEEVGSLNLSLGPSMSAPSPAGDGLTLGTPGQGSPSATDGISLGEEKKQSTAGRRVFLLALVLGLAGAVFYGLHSTPYGEQCRQFAVQQYQRIAGMISGKDDGRQEASLAEEAFSIDRHIAIRDVKQYTVDNKNLGTLLVIEGKVQNQYREPCEMIQVEAILKDAGGNVLATQRRLAGSYISEAQLTLLGRDELESLINSNVSIISNNFHVLHGGEVPFTIVFRDFPLEATDYTVRVADAAIENTKGNLSQ